MKKDILFLVLIILLLLVFGFYFFFAEEASELAYKPVDVGGGAITVEDQYELNQVTLNAELAAPGFITIHEMIGPAPAGTIGVSTYLEAGDYTDLVIDLPLPMESGLRYVAILRADNGNGSFDDQLDFPVEVNGEVIRPDFRANPSEEGVHIEDLNLDLNTVDDASEEDEA